MPGPRRQRSACFLSPCLSSVLCFAGLLKGSRQPIGVRPQAMLEAKDLPVCELSEFLQHRLNIAVQNEHLERAKQAGATHHSQVGSFW